MQVCPECDREYGEEVEFCAHDGSRLRAPEGESEDALIGRILDDRWRIEEKIGEGGMGSIYLASQESVGREVAVKTLRTALSENDEFSERFMREARVTSSINHPHCVTIFDFGRTDDDTLYLAMEFLEGEPLADRMEREPVPMRTIIEIGIQVASALSAAHERDVIHRDLKPDNIFLLDIADGSTFTKVLDFGISKELGSDEDLTQTGQIFGTPDYMSPEQARGDELDPRTDLYSLGCILYEMVADTPPFDRPKAMKILLAHIQDDVTPVSEVADREVPEPVASVIMDLLEKDREERPESAEAVRGMLEEIFENFVGSDSPAPAGGGAAAGPADGRAEEIGKAATVPPGSGEAESAGSAGSGGDIEGAGAGDTAAGPEPERRVAASERDTRPKTESSWVERNKTLVIAFIAIATVGGLLAVGGGAYVAYQGAQDGSGPLASWFGPSSGEAESEDPSPGAAEERGGRADEPRGGARGAPGERGAAETDEKSGEGGGDRAGTGSEKEGAVPSGEGAGDDEGSTGAEPGSSGGDSTGSGTSGGGTSDDGDDPSVGAPAPAGDEGGSEGGADGAEEPRSDEGETGESEPSGPSDPEASEDDEKSDEENSGPDPAQFVRREELSATGAACNKPDIERRLSAIEPQLGRCFSGGAGGSLMLEWTISTEGEPLETAALTSEVAGSVESCAVRTVESLTFSPPDGGRCYTRVTFVFGK